MVHTVLLVLFIGITALLTVATGLNRLRIRRVVFSWGAGRLWGLPLTPTLFLAIVLPVFIYGLVSGKFPPYLSLAMLSGYLLGGVFWYVAALISNAIVITDFGIIRNVNRIGKAVAWGQIVDYVHQCTKNRQRYVFFYMDKQGEKCRLEVTVPQAYRERFDQIVESKLDARFNFSVEQAYGRTTMKP